MTFSEPHIIIMKRELCHAIKDWHATIVQPAATAFMGDLNQAHHVPQNAALVQAIHPFQDVLLHALSQPPFNRMAQITINESALDPFTQSYLQNVVAPQLATDNNDHTHQEIINENHRDL